MSDNWGFVAAAYGVAALVLGGYWRYLRRRDRIHSERASTAPSETSPKENQESGGKAAARTARGSA